MECLTAYLVTEDTDDWMRYVTAEGYRTAASVDYFRRSCCLCKQHKNEHDLPYRTVPCWFYNGAKRELCPGEGEGEGYKGKRSARV